MISLTVFNAVCIVILSYVFIKILKKTFEWRRKVLLLRQFPSDPGHPIFGHLFVYPGPNEEGLAYQRAQTAKYPKVSVAWMMHFPMVIVNHPEVTSIVLKSSEPKSITYRLTVPWIGDGLLNSKGSKWTRNRRLLTSAFHFNILKQYVHLKNTAADILLSKFEHAAETKESFEVFKNVSLFTLDVILRSAMSYETHCQESGSNHPYVQAVKEIIEILVERYFQPWFYGDTLYFLTPRGRELLRHCRLVHRVAEDVISERKKSIQKEKVIHECDNNKYKKNCMDFLDILLTAKDEIGTGLTDREVRDEVDTFLFEGHDTTASAISWALYAVAKHPDIQTKLQQELDSVFGKTESSIYVTWESLSSLPYMTKVIKETMRHYSTVPFIQREMSRDFELDGKIIPKGTNVSIIIYNLHHNPELWEEPMKFLPDRFDEKNNAERNPFTFTPFSAGPRNCIGQNFAMDEIQIALAKILHRFSLKVDETHKVEQLETMVMKAKYDIKLYVERR